MKLFLKKSIVTSPFILDTIGFSKKAGEFMLEFTPDVRKIDGLQSSVRPKTRLARTLALQNPVQTFDLHAEGQSSSIAVSPLSRVFLQTLFTLYTVLLFNFSLSIGFGQDTDPPIDTPTSFLTELFDDNDFDLQFTTLTFTPDGSASHYKICREAASSFLVDPIDHTPLELFNFDFIELTLTEDTTFPFFGTSYPSFFVNSNGYITFVTRGFESEESLEAHFIEPRIAAYFDDLDPPSSGSISWEQLNDRVVVTFEEISESFNPDDNILNSNSFQIELFFDGTIRITWLGMDAVDGLVGLSRGEDIPADFVESNLSASRLCNNELGQIVLGKTIYSCGSVLTLDVWDLNAQDAPLMVTATSLKGDVESFSVTDPDGDKIYSGSIPIGSATDPVEAGDTILQGSALDAITVTYNDMDDGSGNPLEISETATLDCQPPIISEIKVVDTSIDGFTITFASDEPTSAKVSAGLSCANQTLTGFSPLNETHSITFEELSECTSYWFTIEVTDEAGNSTVDDNGGPCHRAITLTRPVLFSDDFEALTDGWTATGLWHQVDTSSNFPEAHSGVASWWYGSEETGNYNVPPEEPNTGALRSAPILLQADPATSLSFYSWRQTKGLNSFETMSIYIEHGESFDLLHQIDSGFAAFGDWEKVGPLDLGPFAGKEIQLVFVFDKFEGNEDTFRGWYIDDVVLETEELCNSESGTVQLSQQIYSCGQLLGVQVQDVNAPAEPFSVVLSTASGDSESILVEDADGDKTYNGSLQIAAGDEPVVADDNRLQGNSTDTITIIYNDVDTGGGIPFAATKTVTLDCEAPVISVDPQELSISAGIPAPDILEGISATDEVGGDLTDTIVVGGDTVDTAALGTYTVTYDIVDSVGNAAVQQNRIYQVIDDIPPVITMEPNVVALAVGSPVPYLLSGVTAGDGVDGDLTGSIIVGGEVVDTETPGTYTVTYDVTDIAGNAAVRRNRFYSVRASGAPGLPFAENFADTTFIDGAKTTANLNIREQAVRLAWEQRRFGALTTPPVMEISSDQDQTQAVVLGDVDGNGELDLVTGNNGVNKLYLNTGLSEAPFANTIGINITDDADDTESIAIGDVDGDGDLDIVAGNIPRLGIPGSGINRLYLNNGTRNPFANVSGVNVTEDAEETSSIALGDVDGDGDLDVVAGNFSSFGSPGSGVNRLYLNNGTENPFANVTGINITDDDDETKSITLGDVDGDGDLDVVTGNSYFNRLYLNNGTENPFANVTGVKITDDVDGMISSITLGDMDGDGDLDIINGVSAHPTDKGEPNRLYFNNGTKNPFENVKGVTITEDADFTESIALGDVDGDGDLDVVAGNGNAGLSRLYLNNGTENPFANVTAITLPDEDHDTNSLTLGDIDGDGDLDIVAGGKTSFNFIGTNRLYVNNSSENPFASVTPITLTFDIDRPYTVALGDMDGDDDLDIVAENRLFLNNGTENPFANVNGLIITEDFIDFLALGDMDGDGDLDIVAGNSGVNRLYLNNGTENPFANVNGISISDDDDSTESIALGDVDGDGDLDVVAGNCCDGIGAVNRLYLNNGTENPFANVEGIDLTEDIDNTDSIVLGDLDGDGDLDVVADSRLYLNNGTDNPFADVSGIEISVQDTSPHSIALGDMDGDGDLDIVADKLYLNNGSEDPFAGVNGIDITGHGHIITDELGSLTLGDVDGDGDLDLIINNFGTNDLYLNNGTANPFANVDAIHITRIIQDIDADLDAGEPFYLALGDVDGDDDLDMVTRIPDINHLYLNNGTENPFAHITNETISDDADDTESLAVGDMDGDGDLDVVAGNSGVNRLYLNNGTENPFANVVGINITDDDDSTISIAVNDMDGDGDLDVVAGNFSFEFGEGAPNRLYLNNGTEDPFANVDGVNISNDADETESLGIGDVDGDGDLDVVAGNSSFGEGVPDRLYLNNGTENPFADVTGINISDDADDTESIALGDVDGDGNLDVVAGNRLEGNGGAIRIYLNNGSTNPFANFSEINIPDDTRGNSLTLGDVDGDGDLDIVTGGSFFAGDSFLGGGFLRLYLNNGTENPFANVTALTTMTNDGISHVGLWDVDGDGDLDIGVSGSRAMDIYLNNGSSNPFATSTEARILFEESLSQNFGISGTTSAIFMDVNGDQSIELITGRIGLNYMYFLDSSRPPKQSEAGYQTHLGTVESQTINDRAEPIHSATLTAIADISLHTRIDFYLTNNGGLNWSQVHSGSPIVFPTTGSDMRWKAELHSLSPAVTPVLHSITVTGNSAPTDIIISNPFILENQENGTEISGFEVVDIDGGSHTYALVDGDGGDDNGLFLIEDNVLKSNAVFDFENEENKRSYSILVRATDNGEGTFEKQFTIALGDANDPPTGVSLLDNTISENLPPGAVIGILTVEDIDLEDIHLFTLSEEMADNDRFAIDGTLLLSKESFDFEARDTYTIGVRVTDGGNSFIEEKFTIMIEDVNDTATIQIVSSPPEPPETVGFGKNATAEVFIFADDQDKVSGVTQFEFLGPDGFLETFDRQTVNGATLPVSFAPTSVGDWTLTVRWLGNDDVDDATAKIQFTVEKSNTLLELFYLGVPQILGQGRVIPGRLVLANRNPGGLDLSGLEIVTTITRGDTTGNSTATTDSDGNFEVVIRDTQFFNSEGSWDITATFSGTENLNPSDIGDDKEIQVRQTHGYAILVHGSIADGEGVDEHGNTIDFVRRSFESAGFEGGVDDPDIRIISHNTPEPKAALEEAITVWAKQKMLAAPAPLYLVLVNHGSVGRFHMHPDELTAGELDTMLDQLQIELAASKNDLVNRQPIVSILGMCFSGSFISDLTETVPDGRTNNRIVISAAAADEFSIRGTDGDNERQGEQFVYLLFRELNKGLSLTQSFQNARTTIRQLSADRNLAININADDPSFPGEKGQHPLLDDNGDSIGSSDISEFLGDGALASTLFLTRPTNAIPALQIDRVSPSVFLGPDEAIPPRMLWAEIDEKPEKIRRIWMDVKKLDANEDNDDANDDVVDENSTMQHSINFTPPEPMDDYVNGRFIGYQWPRTVGEQQINPKNLFSDSGRYQVMFYAESTDDRFEISDPVEVFVYRAPGNDDPCEFSLVSPEENGLIDYNPATPSSSGMFTWEATSEICDEVTYIYRVWADPGKDTLIFESGPLDLPRVFLPPEHVVDGETYWWDVVAVDPNGNFSESNLSQFSVRIPNVPPGLLLAFVKDAATGVPIVNATISVASLLPLPADVNGLYFNVAPAGIHNLIARAPGYSDLTMASVEIRSIPAVTQIHFNLTGISPAPSPLAKASKSQDQGIFTLDIASEPQGIEIGGSVDVMTDATLTLDAGTALELTAPEFVSDIDGHYKFVHWSVDGTEIEEGQTTIGIELLHDRTVSAVYRPVIGISLDRGWNLISVPLITEDFTVDTIFADDSQSIPCINGVICEWTDITFDPTPPLPPDNDNGMDSAEDTFIVDDHLQSPCSGHLVCEWNGMTFVPKPQMHPGYGYWIDSTEETFIEINGDVPDPLAESYEPGWHLLGVKGAFPFPVDESLDYQGSIWGWDSENQEYYILGTRGEPSEDPILLIPGEGYWIYFGEPTILEFE